MIITPEETVTTVMALISANSFGDETAVHEIIDDLHDNHDTKTVFVALLEFIDPLLTGFSTLAGKEKDEVVAIMGKAVAQ